MCHVDLHRSSPVRAHKAGILLHRKAWTQPRILITRAACLGVTARYVLFRFDALGLPSFGEPVPSWVGHYLLLTMTRWDGFLFREPNLDRPDGSRTVGTALASRPDEMGFGDVLPQRQRRFE